MFGIWPGVSYVTLRRLFWSITLIIAQVSQYAYLVLHFYIDDLADLMDNLSSSLAYSLLFFKLITFWINQRWADLIVKSFSIHISKKLDRSPRIMLC